MRSTKIELNDQLPINQTKMYVTNLHYAIEKTWIMDSNPLESMFQVGKSFFTLVDECQEIEIHIRAAFYPLLNMFEFYYHLTHSAKNPQHITLSKEKPCIGITETFISSDLLEDDPLCMMNEVMLSAFTLIMECKAVEPRIRNSFYPYKILFDLYYKLSSVTVEN